MLSTISRSSSTTSTFSFSISLSPFPCFYLTTGFCCFPQGISFDFIKIEKIPLKEGIFQSGVFSYKLYASSL